MPLFEYLCKDCGKEFEKIVPRHDSHGRLPALRERSHVDKQLVRFCRLRLAER